MSRGMPRRVGVRRYSSFVDLVNKECKLQVKPGTLHPSAPVPCCRREPSRPPAPATSAPGLGSPVPHLHRDWAHPCHICVGTGRRRARRLIMRRRRPPLELKVVEIKGYSKKDGATSLRVSDNHGLVEVTAPDLKRCAPHPCRTEPRVRKRRSAQHCDPTDVTACAAPLRQRGCVWHWMVRSGPPPAATRSTLARAGCAAA